MRFVKFKEEEADIKAGKEYQIKLETHETVIFFDEEDNLRVYIKHQSYCLFEIIDRPVMVKAWDDNGLGFVEQELIHDLGESFEYRYICKDSLGGVKSWKNIEYIKDKLEGDAELNEIDSLKEDVKLLKGQVSDILRLLNQRY